MPETVRAPGKLVVILNSATNALVPPSIPDSLAGVGRRLPLNCPIRGAKGTQPFQRKNGVRI
jgi:hypothetical protein